MCHLYKYLPPERLDVLERGQLRLTQPACLNDPHDALLALRLRVEEQAGLVRPEADDFRVERYAALCLRDRVSRSVGVLSFSSDPLCHLMWAHYGRGHTGFALHVAPTHAFFRRDVDFRIPGMWQSVRFPGISFPSPVTYLQQRRVYYDGQVPLDFLFQKSWHWAYEQEYRCVMSLADAPVVDSTKNDRWPVHLLDLPPGVVDGVTIGLAASEDLRRAIQARCAALSVPVFEIVADHTTYDLRSVRCGSRSR